MTPETLKETTEGGLLIRDLLAVLEPVIDWYQSDEHPEREPLDILRDIVDDLQADRKASIVVSSAATDALALCHQIERCGCSSELTDASVMASRLREKLSSANAEIRHAGPDATDKQEQRKPALPASDGSASMDFWELTSVWIQAVKGRYAGHTGSDLNQIFMRGPFAGWSERELYELAKRMDEAQTKFPIWPNASDQATASEKLP